MKSRMVVGKVKRRKILKGKETGQRTLRKTLSPTQGEHSFTEAKRKYTTQNTGPGGHYFSENMIDSSKSAADICQVLLFQDQDCPGAEHNWAWSTRGLRSWGNSCPSLHSSTPCSNLEITSDLQSWYPICGEKGYMDSGFCDKKHACSLILGQNIRNNKVNTEGEPREEQLEHWRYWRFFTRAGRACWHCQHRNIFLLLICRPKDKMKNP